MWESNPEHRNAWRTWQFYFFSLMFTHCDVQNISITGFTFFKTCMIFGQLWLILSFYIREKWKSKCAIFEQKYKNVKTRGRTGREFRSPARKQKLEFLTGWPHETVSRKFCKLKRSLLWYTSQIIEWTFLTKLKGEIFHWPSISRSRKLEPIGNW